jgi:hypothetical protein
VAGFAFICFMSFSCHQLQEKNEKKSRTRGESVQNLIEAHDVKSYASDFSQLSPLMYLPSPLQSLTWK